MTDIGILVLVLTRLPGPDPSHSLSLPRPHLPSLDHIPSPLTPAGSKPQTETPHHRSLSALNLHPPSHTVSQPPGTKGNRYAREKLSHGPRPHRRPRGWLDRGDLASEPPPSPPSVSVWLSFGLNAKVVTHHFGPRAGPSLLVSASREKT